ncbi:MAG TPA: VanZ family protein [Minicystis sp.]|nr:VanZ family protein [Minicystis sp.]
MIDSHPSPRLAFVLDRRAARFAFAAWLALVVAVSIGAYAGALPTSLPAVPGADKVGHFFLIGGLVFFLDAALARRDVGRRGVRVPLAAVLVLVPAAIEEYLQRLSPRRSSSFGDYAADVAGVAALTWLSRRFVALRS